jgi:AcrR family transcriptional regulator
MTATSRRRRGRTPILDPSGIAEAVRRVGEENLSMRAVADDLGVDVTTLYRHVGGIDALRQISARLLAPAAGEWPSPKGETWQSWLTALARSYRQALLASPDLMEFAGSALDPDFQRLEHATRVLVDFGFDARAAAFAHGFVINTVVGYVHQEHGEREQAARGNSDVTRFVQALAADSDGGALTMLRSVEFGPKDFDPDTAFERFLAYAIDGIAAQPGVPHQRSTKARRPR